ncbi:MAG: hypothetical protein ACLU7E_19065 [Clostridium butyricum]
MQIGNKARIIKDIKGKGLNTDEIIYKKGRIYALSDKITVIEYIKQGSPTYRESFNIADVIENKVMIEVFTNGEWVQVTKQYFKI